MTRPVDTSLANALLVLLHDRHKGQRNASSWEEVRAELVAEGVKVGVTRRLEECADHLRDQGHPVVGLSESGVFLAEAVEEVERAYAQRRGRCLQGFKKLRPLKRILLAMRGQRSLPEGA